jgi:tetratricopeptide (TPR) repeat protein
MGIHCANAVLLFLALRLMTGTLWPCVVVTALFAVHPLRVESVAWAAERKDVLCGLFWMASMLAYAFYVRRRPLLQSSLPEAAGTLGIYLLITLFFGLALLAKSMAVTLPCVFLLLDAWPLDRWRKALWRSGRRAGAGPDFVSASRLLFEKLPWFAMVIYDCQQTVIGQDKGVALNSWEGLPLGPRLFNALISLGAYLGQMFWPAGLAPFYPHLYILKSGWSGWGTSSYCQAVIGGIILAVVTAAVIWFRRKSYLAVGWFWFLGTLMPVIGILQVGTQARADRYTYLPMIGVYLMIVWLLKEAADRWPQTRIALAAASVLVFTVLGAVAFKQVSYWINSYVLFEHAVAVTDKNWFAYNHLGIQYDHDGMELLYHDPQAGTQLRDSIAFAVKKWGLEKLAETDKQQAAQILLDHSAENFKNSIDIKPDYDFGNNNLGVYFARKSKPEDLALAEKYFRGALRSNYRYADAFNNLGSILRRQGKYREAVESHLNGIKIRPDRASDHNNLSATYLALDELDNALLQNDLALRCDPNFVGAWLTRAELLRRQKKLDEAAECLKTIVRIDPKSPDAPRIRFQIGMLYAEQKRFGDAVEYLKTIIQIDPNSIDSTRARFQIGTLYAEQKRFDEAIAWYTRVLAVISNDPQVYFSRGEAYQKKGDLNRAKDDFEQVVRLAPQFPGAGEKLSAIRSRLADPQK